jgi:Na+-transporting NADH:ubiquinone oxidoreductase subunit NqrF
MAGQEYAVKGFPVKAFDPATNGRLLGLLRSSDTLTFFSGPPASRARANSEYDQLASLFTTAKALALDSTSSTGNYSMTVPSMDSVLVFGFEEREDMPEYYQYYMIGGRSNVSVLFDMAGGDCGPAGDTTKRH